MLLDWSARTKQAHVPIASPVSYTCLPQSDHKTLIPHFSVCCFNAWKPRHYAKMKKQKKHTIPKHNHFNILAQDQHVLDQEECEEVIGSSTCWRRRTVKDTWGTTPEKVKNIHSRTIHYKYVENRTSSISHRLPRRNVATMIASCPCGLAWHAVPSTW